MSFSNTLTAILAQAKAAARLSSAASRALTGTAAPGRLAAILTEIEETVLPRALTFAIGDDARLVVEARGRRLAKIEDIAGCEVANGDWAAELKGAVNDDAREAALMARLILGFAAVDGPLAVTSQPTGLSASFVSKGQATETVAAAITAEGGIVEAEAAPAASQTAVKTTGEEASPPDDTSDKIGPVQAESGARDTLFRALAASGTGAAHASATGKIESTEGLFEGKSASNLAKALVELEKTSTPFTKPLMAGDTLVVISTGNGPTRLCCSGGADGIAFGAASVAQLAPVLADWIDAVQKSS